MKATAYVRVSSRAQDDATQRTAITRIAAARGDEVDDWRAEKRSARTMDRAELVRLLADARAGRLRGRRLYLFRLDRLTRTGIADNAAFTCRVSSRTVSNPACVSPACSHCDNGPASSPIRFTGTPSSLKKQTRASGSLATFASFTILPRPSTTQTPESSNETSIPA